MNHVSYWINLFCQLWTNIKRTHEFVFNWVLGVCFIFFFIINIVNSCFLKLSALSKYILNAIIQANECSKGFWDTTVRIRLKHFCLAIYQPKIMYKLYFSTVLLALFFKYIFVIKVSECLLSSKDTDFSLQGRRETKPISWIHCRELNSFVPL